jgi:F-type H+-transporting ATPase subunit c
MLTAVFAVFFTKAAFADAALEATSSGDKGAYALAAGLAIGIAAMGGAIGQGKIAASAMEGIARNPEATGKVMTPMIIALALVESLVIYALVIAFLLEGNI